MLLRSRFIALLWASTLVSSSRVTSPRAIQAPHIRGGHAPEATSAQHRELSCMRCKNPGTAYPTSRPTRSPTRAAAKIPTKAPTRPATRNPSRAPTPYRSTHRTKYPSKSPTKFRSKHQTKFPSKSPTKLPSKKPTKRPSKAPSKSPTRQPTMPPTDLPTRQPTHPAPEPHVVEDPNGEGGDDTPIGEEEQGSTARWGSWPTSLHLPSWSWSSHHTVYHYEAPSTPPFTSSYCMCHQTRRPMVHQVHHLKHLQISHLIRTLRRHLIVPQIRYLIRQLLTKGTQNPLLLMLWLFYQ